MRRFLYIAASLLALAAGADAAAFMQNEVRAAAMRDVLRSVRATLREGTGQNKQLIGRVVEAFKGERDWAKDVEAYYALAAPLAARAMAVEGKLEAVLAQNTVQNDEKVKKSLDKLFETAEALRADYELYTRLPFIAGDATQRAAAQASMRLLAQTGAYGEAAAYFKSRSEERKPFSIPPAPGPALIRRR